MKRIGIFLGYLLQVLVGLVEIAAVLYVFSRLNTRFEFIVVSILGLMYGSLRTIGIGLWQMLARLGVSIDREFSKLRRLHNAHHQRMLEIETDLFEDVDEKCHDEEVTEAIKVIERQFHKTYITSFTIGIIWLICGYHLLTS